VFWSRKISNEIYRVYCLGWKCQNIEKKYYCPRCPIWVLNKRSNSLSFIHYRNPNGLGIIHTKTIEKNISAHTGINKALIQETAPCWDYLRSIKLRIDMGRGLFRAVCKTEAKNLQENFNRKSSQCNKKPLLHFSIFHFLLFLLYLIVRY